MSIFERDIRDLLTLYPVLYRVAKRSNVKFWIRWGTLHSLELKTNNHISSVEHKGITRKLL